jgi:hypothetical protein
MAGGGYGGGGDYGHDQDDVSLGGYNPPSHKVWQCRLTLPIKPMSKPCGTKRGNSNMMNRFQVLLSKSTCAATTRSRQAAAAAQPGCSRNRCHRRNNPTRPRLCRRTTRMAEAGAYTGSLLSST